MTPADAVAWWHGRINYEVRAATPADLKLERMRALLARLGDPHGRLRIAHVAGTKGKGSTCALVEAAARAAGYRVGLFTSPHLEHVSERIQIDRVPVSAAELTALLTDIAPAVHALDGVLPGGGPTFFEVTTALGLLHCVRRRAEVVVVEVGLGGRFDATNVCDPVVSAVTSIGLDHTAQLGHTAELIAYQKAGVAKRGVPLVVGPLAPGPRAVTDRAAADAGAHVVPTDALDPPPVGLPGAHQRANGAVALGIVRELRRAGLVIPDAAVRAGFAGVRWPARVELVRSRPAVILDSAHNEPSAEALVAAVPGVVGHPVRPEECHLIFAVAADKPVSEMAVAFGKQFGHFHLTRFATNPRSVPVEELARIVAAAVPGAVITTHPDGPAAYRAARLEVATEGVIAVAGSLFLAGEIGPIIRATEKNSGGA